MPWFTAYESLIPLLKLPDPDDRHVLAEAIVSRCDVIVTANLKDFPVSVLEPSGIEAQHPDEFLCNHLVDFFPFYFGCSLLSVKKRLIHSPTCCLCWNFRLEPGRFLRPRSYSSLFV